MANRVKEIWASGGSVVNGWLAIPSGFSAEKMAQCGFDAITVDLQHGLQDYASMLSCFQAMAAWPVTPMVRVPWREPGIIGKVLDAGAMGVICPMVNSRAEAEELVRFAKYPPLGARSNGPIRAAMYEGGADYQKIANDETLLLPMIETREAVEHLDEILSVPGLAGCFIGPSDLAFSYGKEPKFDHEEPFFLEIYQRIIAACRRYGLQAGIFCGSGAYAKRAFEMGFTLATPNSDVAAMVQATRAELVAARAK